MENGGAIKPILKWVGGKRQLLPVLAPLVPAKYTMYCEPFLGGGALFFSRQPRKARLNDVNAEIINVYETVRDDVEAVVADLKKHKNNPEYYYAVRNLDRDGAKYAKLSRARRASRILYLNKTCYNGLYRVNRAGEYNVPFGRYANPDIVNAGTLRAVSAYLREAGIVFSSTDYAETLAALPKGAFVYLDPPYLPVSETANFTAYAKGGFGPDEQVRLKECCDRLDRRGIRFMLSNSAAGFIRELYGAYRVDVVLARRAVNSAATKRGAVEEVVVRNY